MRVMTTAVAIGLIVAALLWAAIAIVRWQTTRRLRAERERDQEREPLEILQRQFARGEITYEEFFERESALRSSWRD